MTQLTVKTAAALARPLGFTIRRTTPGESELVAYWKGEGVVSPCAYFSDCPLDVLATAAGMAESAGADPEAVKAARAACGVPARFTLSDTAFETLRIFCAYHLKGDLDATIYAEGLVSEYENWEGDVIFEIRGFHTASGNPATIRFDQSTDFE